MNEARALANHLLALYWTPPPVKPGYRHMGMALTDAALQTREKYTAVSKRVQMIGNALAGRETVQDLRDWLDAHDPVAELSYKKPWKFQTLSDLVDAFLEADVHTSDDFRARLTGPERDKFLRSVRSVKGVGDKTVGYLDILAGLDNGTAIDSRVRRVMQAAGIDSTQDYCRLRAIVERAAKELGWTPGSVDAALWAAGGR